MLRKLLLENAFDTKYVQNHYFAGKCSENHYLKMHVASDICAKHDELLWRQMWSRKIIYTTCVQKCYFAGKCSSLQCMWHHILQNLYFEGKCSRIHHCIWHQICKIVMRNGNAKEIITKCIWHHIYTKSLLCRQMLRNLLLEMHLTANMSLLWQNAHVKCIFHQICAKWLLWRQMLRKLLHFWCQNVQNHHFAGLSMVFFLHVTSVYGKCFPWEFSDKCDVTFLHL